MITILFSPFKTSEGPDFIKTAEFWRYTITQKHKPNLLVEYQSLNNIDLKNLGPLTIYILGHETATPFFIGANDNVSPLLSVSEMSARFTETFLPYKTQLSKVKLYFCNESNTDITAKIFEFCTRAQFQFLSIFYYHGSISSPYFYYGINTKASIKANGEVVKASTVRKVLPRKEDSEGPGGSFRAISLFSTQKASFEARSKERRNEIVKASRMTRGMDIS